MKRNRSLKYPSLSSLLFEDVGDDIQAAYDGGPSAVRNLMNTAKDKVALKKALAGSADGDDADDKVTVSGPTAVAVGGLLPTQKEIDLKKSIAYPLGDIGALKTMLKTKQSTAGSIAKSDNLVLDGHHRWSQVWGILGPEGKILATDYAFPGDQSKKLAALQLAIAAADPNPSDPFPSASEPFKTNIMGKDAATIADMIKKNIGQGEKPMLSDDFLKAAVNDPDVSAWAGYEVGADNQAIIDAIANKVGQNLSTLPDNPEAPARADMPQLDHPTIGGSKGKNKITAKLPAGEYNVVPPFKSAGGGEAASAGTEAQKESIRKSDAVIMERWQRLAGLIKD